VLEKWDRQTVRQTDRQTWASFNRDHVYVAIATLKPDIKTHTGLVALPGPLKLSVKRLN